MKQGNAKCIWMRTQSCDIWANEENCPDMDRCRFFMNMNEKEGLDLKKAYNDDLIIIQNRLREKWEMIFNYYRDLIISPKPTAVNNKLKNRLRGECIK